MENNLQKGWIIIPFTEVLDIQGGTQPPKNTFKYESAKGFIRLLQIRDFGEKPLPTYIHERQQLKTCEEDDILIARYGASIGRIVTGMKGAYNVALAKVIIPEPLDKNYIKYLLKSEVFQRPILSIQRSAQDGFNKDDLAEIEIPFPPLPEQHRIVAKLDAVMQKVESNKQRLEKIPKLLKRFRQSVLAAAVNNDGDEEITKNVCEEIQIGPFGTQLHRHEYISSGIPLVNPTHIQDGNIIPDMDLTISKAKFKELSNYHLKEGDVIMGRRGEMARCALVGRKEDGWLCGTGSLFFRPNLKKINPQYLYLVLSNSNTKAFLEGEAKGSTMSNLNLNIVRNIPFPLPSLTKQTKIVKQVEQLFAFADKIEARYTKAKAMLDKLPQSILAKAFRGELVPQNPNDEPASMLLERIKAEKEKLAKEKKDKKSKLLKNRKN